MKLVPWNKSDLMRPWASRQQEVSRLLNDFFGDHFFSAPLSEAQRWSPALDLSETDDAVIVKAELPGIDAKDVEIQLHEDVLTIRGEKKEEKEEKTSDVHWVERTFGTFERSIRLPGSIKGAEAKATFKNGILTITLAKAEESKPKVLKIDIE